jgi:hypothetical protein
LAPDSAALHPGYEAATCSILRVPMTVALEQAAKPDVWFYRHLLPPLGNEAEDLLLLDSYSPASGRLPLRTCTNANCASCSQCVLVLLDADSGTAISYFADRGTLILEDAPGTDPLPVRLDGVRVIEVTIDPNTFESTPVVNGGCFEFDQQSMFADGFEAVTTSP